MQTDLLLEQVIPPKLKNWYEFGILVKFVNYLVRLFGHCNKYIFGVDGVEPFRLKFLEGEIRIFGFLVVLC